MSFGPSPPGVALPSLPGRVALGLLRMVPVFVLLVGIPSAVLGYLAAAGVHSGVSLFTVTIGGLLFTAFSTARFILRPTRAFGPIGMARGGAAFAYLWLLVPNASILVAAGMHTSLLLHYGSALEALLVVPVLMVITAGLVTAQDSSNLTERLRADFPARR
ncbi:MAG: hypothetical protein L3K04_05255 [Thermoplasmata archaeon]|nr:hypothetical protein [Thermoplasmata archaeon]MCI4338575.1 hypothetical protein [Thermoplasmata archaeon]MCI4341088.1 hypothetical protein [Thermoplasmata archaeon]